MRLIDADLAKVMSMHRARLVHYGFEDRLCVPYDAVDEVPTVGDAVLVVHGRWEYSAQTIHTQSLMRCSICGWWTLDPSVDGAYHYCPNCGAKMDVEENNGVD